LEQRQKRVCTLADVERHRRQTSRCTKPIDID
jgi:hypothetical protein